MAMDDKKKAERQAAKKFLRKHLNGQLPSELQSRDEIENFFGQVMKAVDICIGAGVPGGHSPKNSTLSKLQALFRERDVVDELDLFKATRMGRAEMRKWAKALIRDVAPEDRIWVAFDTPVEEWVVIGRGADMPETWTGYKPAN